jgi:hypothetical protein
MENKMSTLKIDNTDIRLSKIESITFKESSLNVEIRTISGKSYYKEVKTISDGKKIVSTINNSIDSYEL